MTIGDKVKHLSGAFDFRGAVIGMCLGSGNRKLVIVEQEGTNFVQVFIKESLTLMSRTLPVGNDTEWFESIVPPPPPPKPEFPVELFIPVKPRPKNGITHGHRGFISEVRLNYLPLKPISSLITENVKAELEFHFMDKSVGDIDNLAKPSLDLLKGSLIYDDSQVKELSLKYVVPSTRTGFKVRLTKYEVETEPAA